MSHAIHAHQSCMHVVVRVLHSSAFNISFDDQQCFIFRGFPDIIIIIIHKECGWCHAVVYYSVNNVGSDEESVLENSWQRTNAHKRSDIDSPPAKLGEVVVGLHNVILLTAKIL